MDSYAEFDNDADDDIEERHYGKPYDRKLYNELAGIMKHKHAAVDKDAADLRTQRLHPSPLTERFKDIRKYLYQHQPEANTDTALVACLHTNIPYYYIRAMSSMMKYNPIFPLTVKERCRAIGKTPLLVMEPRHDHSLASLLVKRLSVNPTDYRSGPSFARVIQSRHSEKKSPLLLENGKKR